MTQVTAPKDLVFNVHVFCCTNQRAQDHPRSSCAARGSVDLHALLKARSKELGISGIRVNKAGCLDRCELGPVMVIYPQAVWYHFETEADVDEILSRHILGNEIVERLLLETDQKLPKPHPEALLNLVVEKIEPLTDTIKKFVLKPEQGGPLPTFVPGSHIDIFTDTGLRRSYSLVNGADQPFYEIAVLREAQGRGGSRWMHDQLAIGDSIRATAPKNLFAIDDTATRHILMAGGIGVTPLLAMGRHLRSLGVDVTLHYSTRSPQTTAYADEVARVFGTQAVIYHDGGDPENGADLDAILTTPSDDTCLYICGPAGYMAAVRAAASHWREDRVRFEQFAAPPLSDSKPVTNKPFEVVLARQGKTLIIPSDKTILEVVQAQGIPVEASCQSGFCGSCKTVLLSGTADHRDSVLSDAEKAGQKTIMICSSRAQKGETLILDI